MPSLALAACFFVGIHLFVAGTPLRDRITGAIGELPYLVGFSLASTAGIVWLCSAYGSAETTYHWVWPSMLRPLSTALVGVAFVLVVVGVTTPNPAGQGGEARLQSADAATGILRITRHPFLVGVALWAAVHLVANGDSASLLFFASLLLLSAAGTASIDRKRVRKHGDAYRAFEAQTSILPFGAIIAGRNRLQLGELLGWRPAVAVGAFAVALMFHATWFGASPL